jgi:radical SAM-linked protein
MTEQKNVQETRIRFKFYKKDEFKYLSHLDISRIMIRALRRAELEIKYGQGYNPKPKIGFSPPTPLGVESMAEYADVLLDGDIDANEFKKKLNLELKPQMQISEVKKITEKTDNLMNAVSLVLYGFELYICSSDNEDLLKRFYTELKEDLTVRSDFSRSIFDLKIIPLKGISDIILLKLLGYAKIFKEENNEIFKFNNFYEYFENWLKKYCLNIKDVKKEELFVMSGSVLKTPMEIV